MDIMGHKEVGSSTKARSLRDRVAANVRAEMARHDVSATELAEALGLSVQSVSQKRRGEVAFTLNDLELIAPLFGMTPGELVDGNIVYVDFVSRGPRVDFSEAQHGPLVIEGREHLAERGSPPRVEASRGTVAPTGVDPVTFRFSVERSTN